MANVIILSYGEGRHLINKPADYETLLDFTRVKFPELEVVYDDEIAFHFTPEWFDGDVELDRDAFAEVHNRAVLRITTTAFAPAQRSGNNGNIQAGGFADPRSDYLPCEVMSIGIIHVPTDRKTWFNMKPRTTFSQLMACAATRLGVDLYAHYFYYQDKVLQDYDTPESMAMEDRDLIEMDDGYRI
ncbi:hypothetical protein SLS64_006144 [Diaporthe eres]|uniref:Ubiquitin-like domain-containing protein n=1 Tax=Diaporthe eres TaxID=83184 RepID=A0ABR1P8W0_DIAER